MAQERIKYWLSVGAQPSDRVAWLLAKANLIPAHPKYLHYRGLFDLNDSKSWQVEVKNEAGEILCVCSTEDAKKNYPELAGKLPRDYPRPIPDHPKLDLDKEMGMDLRLLQKMTGIH